MFLQSGLASEDKVLCVQCPHSQDFLFKAKYFETAHVPSVVKSMSHWEIEISVSFFGCRVTFSHHKTPVRKTNSHLCLRSIPEIAMRLN